MTYHGPGQLVAYPILYLPDYGLGPSDYMHRLEDIAAAVCASFGVQTHRRDGIIGVWGWIGVVPLATGLLGWCPAYTLLGIKTCPVSDKK